VRKAPHDKTLKTLSIARTLACIGRTYAVRIFVNPLNSSITNNPDMKNKFFPLLLTMLLGGVALAPLDQAKAIVINPESYGDSQVQVSFPRGGFANTVNDREVFPVGDYPKKLERQTQATFSNQDGTATSNATWTFKSNPNRTVYGGSYTLDASGTRQSLASIGTELSFTLLESASYSITASFDAFFTPTEFSAADMGVSLDRFDPFGRLELASDRNFAGGTVQLSLGELTGTLEPGVYRFGFSNTLVVSATLDGRPTSVAGFGSGNGQFELSLERLHSGGNPHVPEAGSTLAMLGMALAMLGGMTRLRACS
jgi:hypothetical protein